MRAPEKQSKLISQPVGRSQLLEKLRFYLDLGFYLTGIEGSKRLCKGTSEGSRLVSHEGRAGLSLSIQSLSLTSRLVSYQDLSSFPPFSSVSTASDNWDVAASTVSHSPRNGSSSSPDFSACTTRCSPFSSASDTKPNKPSDDHPPVNPEQTTCHSNDISSLPP
jgi:hypothetical protein